VQDESDAGRRVFDRERTAQAATGPCNQHTSWQGHRNARSREDEAVSTAQLFFAASAIPSRQ
jgi:hypothetical protein